MAQQTQVDRVAPRWLEWMERWPTPVDLAAEPAGEAVRAWGRLGYPRRALWLHRSASVITEEHAGVVPRDVETLLSLPGVGPYTARAVAVFAFGDRHPVVDTNTRRVLARALHGQAQAGMPAARDLSDLLKVLPEQREEAAVFNAAIMELGATVCTATTPQCGVCPVAQWCAWKRLGFPDNAPQKRPRQAAFAGSDRQVRGRVMAAVRDAPHTLTEAELLERAAEGGVKDEGQPARALTSLVQDGLLVARGAGFTLP